MSQNNLTATYVSPNSTQTFSLRLPSISHGANGQDVKEKSAYLSALHTNISQMQSDVNAFLTQKMEEEKTAEASKVEGKKTAREQKEEEMYGEEDPEAEG